MLAVVVLLVSNMGVAAGAESGSLVLKATPWLVALVAATGIGYAQYLKRRAPRAVRAARADGAGGDEGAVGVGELGENAVEDTWEP